eukprot:7385519-Prymnesium_polylepis.1
MSGPPPLVRLAATQSPVARSVTLKWADSGGQPKATVSRGNTVFLRPPHRQSKAGRPPAAHACTRQVTAPLTALRAASPAPSRHSTDGNHNDPLFAYRKLQSSMASSSSAPMSEIEQLKELQRNGILTVAEFVAMASQVTKTDSQRLAEAEAEDAASSDNISDEFLVDEDGDQVPAGGGEGSFGDKPDEDMVDGDTSSVPDGVGNEQVPDVEQPSTPRQDAGGHTGRTGRTG